MSVSNGICIVCKSEQDTLDVCFGAMRMQKQYSGK